MISINTVNSTLWKTSTTLHTTTARIGKHFIHTLFDEGSQLNVISSTVVQRIGLLTKLLTQPQQVRYPNNQGDTITYYVPPLYISFPSFHLNNELHRMIFKLPLLVLDTLTMK